MSLLPGSARAEQQAAETTPIGNNGSRTGLTLGEKQAMIEDLQLEISKRARGLRTIYSEQARQLRESLERRIHRIPPRMRSKTMGELVDEQAKKAAAMRTATPKAQPSARPPKRTSDVAFATEDKENAQLGGHPDLEYQKKRAKLTRPQSPMKASVLSPRSHNSRTYPSKITSPEKSVVKPKTTAAAVKPRPVSRATARPATTAARKPIAKQAAKEDSDERYSDGSSASARTTIVKPAAKRAAPVKKPAAKTTTAATRKRAAPAKTESVPASTRTLRKRN